MIFTDLVRFRFPLVESDREAITRIMSDAAALSEVAGPWPERS